MTISLELNVFVFIFYGLFLLLLGCACGCALGILWAWSHFQKQMLEEEALRLYELEAEIYQLRVMILNYALELSTKYSSPSALEWEDCYLGALKSSDQYEKWCSACGQVKNMRQFFHWLSQTIQALYEEYNNRRDTPPPVAAVIPPQTVRRLPQT